MIGCCCCRQRPRPRLTSFAGQPQSATLARLRQQRHLYEEASRRSYFSSPASFGFSLAAILTQCNTVARMHRTSRLLLRCLSLRLPPSARARRLRASPRRVSSLLSLRMRAFRACAFCLAGSSASRVSAPAAILHACAILRVRSSPRDPSASDVIAPLQSARVRHVCACSSARQRRAAPRSRRHSFMRRVSACPSHITAHQPRASPRSRLSLRTRCLRRVHRTSRLGSVARHRTSCGWHAWTISARAHIASRLAKVVRHRMAAIFTCAPCLRVFICSSAPHVSAPAAILWL